MKKERGLALAACAALAALMLLFASQCSPLYPINLWDDANCLLTVGRVMRRGGVLYRDIYEQKGPLLYLIHALAACISDTSFWGVYALEIPALTAALYAAYRLLRLRTGAGFALGAAAVWGALTVTGGAFMRGDSAEEFCLPLLTAALALAMPNTEGAPDRCAQSGCCSAACWPEGIATIKYTLLGAMVGLCAVEGALALKEGGAPRALKSAGVFLAGMAIPILPWVIYFAANGALRDAYTAYIYNNVFLYGGEAASWGQRLGEMARYVQKNALWAVPAALGLAALAADRGETAAVRLCIAAMAAGQFAAVFFVGRVWAYSLLALAAFGVIRLHAAPSRAEKNRLSARKKGADGGGLRGKPAAGVVRHAERISARAEARAACAGAAGGGHAGGRDAAAIQPPRRRTVSGGAYAPAGKILRFAERAARGHARRARPRRARGRPGLCAGQLAGASGGI